MAAVLALSPTYAPRIARAVRTAPRLPVVWLRGQDCAGDTMAFLRAADPTVSQLLLQLLSVEYHETLMAPAGLDATDARLSAMEEFSGGYLAVVEGSIPTADDGASCTIGGQSFREVARDVCSGALATIAVGSCACDGGAPAAGGGPTGAVGVAAVIDGGTLIRLPGCPVNVDYLTATLVHYLTFGAWPETDGMQRPYFAYGSLIHNQCERRPHYEYGEFVLAWGDEGAQKGWCLYKMGCKGPETFGECPTARYASGTSWPVRAGHGCIGCHAPGFWDAMSPFYRRLPGPLPFAPQVTIDQIGALLVGGVLAGTAAHGAASYVRQRRGGGHEEPGAAVAMAAAVTPVVEPAPPPAAAGPGGDAAPVDEGPTPAGPTGEAGPEPGIEGDAALEEITQEPQRDRSEPAEGPAAVDGPDEPGASA